MSKETDDVFENWYKKLFGKPDTVSAKNYMITKLGVSNQYLMDMSQDASEALKQSMVINAIYDAAENNASLSDSYAKSRMRDQTRKTYKAIGMDIAYWMVLTRGCLEVILYAIFPFMFLMFCLPIGITVFKSWVFSLVWIQSWPIMFAIINLIYTLETKSSLVAAEGKITMSNIDSVINQDVAYMAGYLMMATPLLMLKLLQGGIGGAGAHLSSMLTGVGSGTASQVAGEMSTGNMSIGNSSLNNHSYDNVSANKHDTSHLLHTHGFSVSNSDLSMQHIGKGVSSTDMSKAISKLPVDVKRSISASAGLENMKSEHESTAEQFRIESMENTTQGMSQLIHAQHQFNRDKRDGLAYATNASTEVQQAMENVSSIAEKYGITDELRKDAHGETGFGFNLGVAKVGGGIAITKSDGSQASIATEDAESLKKSMSVISNASKTQNFEISNSKGESLTDQVSSSYDKIQSLNKSESFHREKAENLTESIKMAKIGRAHV